jgi:tetratricopeptide (TPR) repeat protein
VAGIQAKVVKQGKRNAAHRVFRAKTDKEMIAAWKQDLSRILQVFNVRSRYFPWYSLTSFQTELAINTHTLVADMHRNALASLAGTIGGHPSVGTDFCSSPTQTDYPLGYSQVSGCEREGFTVLHLRSAILGELPPPPPGACFGRDELIRTIVGFAENLESVALIGAGGIGKTSIALSVLHHGHIKEVFGNNRRFIRCDKFPASHTHLLNRLSKAIGAGIENPEDLTPLRPFLSSSKMILFLDNAESILDPAGPDAQEIYTVVEELARFENICLGITSRISTVPPHCKRPTIPPLSMESACDIFYGIHNSGGRSNVISDLVRRLDFHALSITLLATVASHSMWDYDRLANEWETRRAQVLRTDLNESLAATIELSLASQTFRKLAPSPSPTFPKSAASWTFRKPTPSSTPSKLAPSARELLGVVAFFPQGLNDNNLDWLFPTISNIKHILDKFCTLSLTYRSNGFITMLAPIRDYLVPRDLKSSPLLCTTKERYFDRLSVRINPAWPRFEEGQWIVSDDVNVEHLLDFFLSTDQTTGDILDACHHFMEHLYWYKPRQTILRPKIEALSDDHPSKPKCLFKLSWLFSAIGNQTEQKRLLTRALKLERQRGDRFRTAETLRDLSEVNRTLGLPKEGIRDAKEALEIYKQLNRPNEQAMALYELAWSLLDDKQFDAAENDTFRSINLAQRFGGQEFQICKSHRLLGNIYRSKGERKKAIDHFEKAQELASSPNWHNQLFRIHHDLASLFLGEGEFDDANVQIERAKSYTDNDAHFMGRVTRLQAEVWYGQGRFEEATSEALLALQIFENLGSTKDAVACRELLRKIERGMGS